MDKKIKRRLIWWIALLLLSILSYWREVGFRSVNALIAGETNFYAKTKKISFLTDLTVEQLTQLKYILTLGFTFAFILITYLGIQLAIKNRLGITLTKVIYGVCLIIALVLVTIGISFNQFPTIYPYLRILIGWIHSPLIFLFISIIVRSSNNFE